MTRMATQHKLSTNTGDSDRTFCGHPWMQVFFVAEWQRVTCKRCLAKRPRPSQEGSGK